MDVTMTDIKKLREMTGAGLADCKKALAESDDMDGAVAYLRKKGAAVAAKRSDREAAEGCVLVKAENGFGAIIALKCETDFVANNADFVALTQNILNAAVAAKANADAGKTLYAAVDNVARVTFPVSGINKANNGNDIVVKVQKGGEWYTIEAKKGEPAAKFGCDPKVSHVSEQVSFKSVYDRFTGWVQNKNVKWY